MQNPLTCRLLSALLLLLSCSAALGQQAMVKDDANFFTPAVVNRANADLAQLQQQYRHKVMIETTPTLPTELQGKVDGNDNSINLAYEAYAESRARALAADVFVYINKSPSHLQVVSRNDVARAGLNPTQREGIRRDILENFREKKYDDALTRMTSTLKTTFASGPGAASSASPSAPPFNPAPFNPSRTDPSTPRTAPDTNAPGSTVGGIFKSIGCFGFVILAVVVLLVIRLIRRLFGGGRPGYGSPAGYNQPGGYGQQPGGFGGGGGFGRGMFGGLLGGLFGSYLGNNVFGQGQHTNDPGTTPFDPNSGGGSTGGGDAFGGSGADFGSSDSSSSDFSGGGGDFSGGGDSGGDSGSF